MVFPGAVLEKIFGGVAVAELAEGGRIEAPSEVGHGEIGSGVSSHVGESGGAS